MRSEDRQVTLRNLTRAARPGTVVRLHVSAFLWEWPRPQGRMARHATNAEFDAVWIVVRAELQDLGSAWSGKLVLASRIGLVETPVSAAFVLS